MGRSEECLHEMESAVVAQYATSELGIPLIIHNSVVRNVCSKCGVETHAIPFPDRLIAAAAVGRCKIPFKLAGSEIRFVRKAMCMAAKDLSEVLSVTPETFSRWENDKAPISPSFEKMLRILAWVQLGKSAPAIDFDAQSILNMSIQAIRRPSDEEPMAFELVRFKVSVENPITQAYTEGQLKAA